MKYEALFHVDSLDGDYWRVRCHGDDPVKRPNGTNGLFFITGLTEAQARAVAAVLNNLENPNYLRRRIRKALSGVCLFAESAFRRLTC